MTDVKGSENKLQGLIERFGGWTSMCLLALLCYMYQGDRANTQASIASVEKSVAVNVRAISRLQEGKVSREEFKSVQEQWIRETQGLRMDIRELTNAMRIDLNKKQ